MCRLLALLLLALVPIIGFAQGVGGGSVSGLTYITPITPGDCTKWQQVGVLADAGAACGSGSAGIGPGSVGQLCIFTSTTNCTGTAASTVTVGTATNIAGGAANNIPYQTGAGGTSFVAASASTIADIGATTAYTISGTGCTPTITHAGPFGGTFTLASGPCTAVTIEINGATGFTAPYGYHCSVGDQTAMNAGTWIPAWIQSASTTTTATLPIPAAAATTDVISFNCDFN
jgi:hypothetical protein